MQIRDSFYNNTVMSGKFENKKKNMLKKGIKYNTLISLNYYFEVNPRNTTT